MKLGSYITHTDKLKDEYRKSFDFIEHYGQLHMVSSEKMAEKMMDLLDLMLEAQEKGLPPEEITGKSLEDYCKNYFSDVTWLDMLKSAAKRVKYWAWVVFAVETLLLLSEAFEENFNFFTYRTDITGYLLGIMIAMSGTVLADIIGSILAKKGCYSKKIYNVTLISGTALSIALAVILGLNIQDVELLGYPLISGSLLYLLIYYIVIFISRYKKTGSLKKTQNAYESSFTQLIKEDIKGTDYSNDKSIVKIFAKRYIKKNARLAKKGKRTMTTKEYFDKTNKESRYAYTIGLIIGISVINCGGFVNSILTGEKMFETPLDLLFYVLIYAVVCFISFKFSRKIEKVTLLEQQSILNACREHNMELDEYYNMLMKDE